MNFDMDKEKMLSNPKETIRVIQENNFTFHKKYGQNFLIDAHVIDKIIAASDIDKDTVVLEIGPGIGTLTQYLAEAAGHVIAVEIDDKLIPILGKTLDSYENVTVIHGDILKQDIEEIFCRAESLGKDKSKKFNKRKIVANLPYYITTPIIMSLLESKIKVDSITVMIQKEVADRMQASPGNKDYGALSLAVQYYTEPYIAANVPPNCFMPRPAVGSAFNQRRKTLANAIKNYNELSLTREEVETALEKIGLDRLVRGEKLGLSEFAALSDELL